MSGTITRRCGKHGDYEAQILECFGRTFESGCPECEKQLAREEAEMEREERRNERERSLLRRGIERDYFTADLAGYRAENRSEADALKAAMDMDGGKLEKLLLLGSNGCGKTYLGCALAIKHHGVRTTMFEMGARIRAGYSRGESELGILDGLLSYPLIVLDEIGRTRGSDAEKNWLSYLVDKAHSRHKKLVLISNRQTARNLPPERRGEAIEYYFDNDVISRLRQNSRIVEVKGRDRRATAPASV